MSLKARLVVPGSATLSLPALNVQSLILTLVGDSVLVIHRFGEKARKEIADNQSDQAHMPKEARNPQAEYEECFYRFADGRYGFPSVGIKAAAVTACGQVAKVTKTDARATFHIDGELVEVHGEPVMQTDTVRIGGMSKTTTLRYRPAFHEWWAQFTLKYNADVMSASQVVNLFNVAGFGVGIGEWRPARGGSWGRFHVANESEVNRLTGAATKVRMRKK